MSTWKEGRINLYSDTQTRPTPEMRQVMAAAEVGDEQHGGDPSVNQLCAETAELLGKESAIFLPSGTMCNEIAILVHCRPGDEIYAHHTAHVLTSEAGGPAALAGAQVYPLAGARGHFGGQELRAAIRFDDRYSLTPRMVLVEQTSNAGGGTVWPLEQIQEVSKVAKDRGLSLHMDGARLMNAVVAAGVSAKDFAASFDSVWLDFTKGLGCPLGAVLAGSADFIHNAWKWKQRIGGAMRQAGMMAAGCSYALTHHIDRLAEDHQHARLFASVVAQCDGVQLDPEPVETNLVFFDIAATGLTADEVIARLDEQSITVSAAGPTRLRACTHLDVSREQVEEAANVFLKTVQQLRS